MLDTMQDIKRILIVEDDAFIALDLEDVLSDAGFEVIGPVATVNEAMACLQDDERPDVALLDYNLGDTNSIPVARRLEDLDIPFLFLSGQIKSLIEDQTRTDPLILSKPFVPRHLIRSIDRICA